MDNQTDKSISESIAVLMEEEIAVKEPSLYKVLLHNDDYTPMDFVVEVLQVVFHRSKSAATKIMLDVHHKGVGVCGIYSFEIAETKVNAVMVMAREHEYPLKCTMEVEKA